MKLLELLSFFFMGYIDFKGRCTRLRYWAITPVYGFSFVGITFLSIAFEGWPRIVIFWGFILLTLVPFISVFVKRLHDFNMTGYAAAVLIPVFLLSSLWGVLMAVIVVGVIPPSRGINKFGDGANGDALSVFD
ncbi:MAG: DUF805 domain-containing protein [Alphaproteobacteria bacterium]